MKQWSSNLRVWLGVGLFLLPLLQAQATRLFILSTLESFAAHPEAVEKLGGRKSILWVDYDGFKRLGKEAWKPEDLACEGQEQAPFHASKGASQGDRASVCPGKGFLQSPSPSFSSFAGEERAFPSRLAGLLVRFQHSGSALFAFTSGPKESVAGIRLPWMDLGGQGGLLSAGSVNWEGYYCRSGCPAPLPTECLVKKNLPYCTPLEYCIRQPWGLRQGILYGWHPSIRAKGMASALAAIEQERAKQNLPMLESVGYMGPAKKNPLLENPKIAAFGQQFPKLKLYALVFKEESINGEDNPPKPAAAPQEGLSAKSTEALNFIPEDDPSVEDYDPSAGD